MEIEGMREMREERGYDLGRETFARFLLTRVLASHSGSSNLLSFNSYIIVLVSF